MSSQLHSSFKYSPNVTTYEHPIIATITDSSALGDSATKTIYQLYYYYMMHNIVGADN